MTNQLTIVFCMGCRWLLRASWLSQECMTTFYEHLGEVTLRQGEPGEFSVWLNGECLWDRKRDGGFPELAPLKQQIRDRVAPDLGLGHSDRMEGL